MKIILDIISDYLFFLRHQKLLTEGTLLTYAQTMKLFWDRFGMKTPQDLLPSDMIKFRRYLSIKPCIRKEQIWMSENSINGTMIRLKAFIKRLSENGLLRELKPCDVPINKSILSNPTYLTEEELKCIFSYLDDKVSFNKFNKYQSTKRDYKYSALMLRAMVHMLYASGLRNAELRRLRLSDLDLQQNSGRVLAKGWQINSFTFTHQAKIALLDFLEFKQLHYANSIGHMSYIFTSANFGAPIQAVSLNLALKKLGEECGLSKRLHSHVFRHSCATSLLNHGVDIKTVQQKLNHVNLDTTAIYLHITNKQLTEATNKLEIL